ncbi:sensor histidine kinase [Demequina lignilytica]|uniref:Histidine kinase n=1 Tax=Demequina lignilytica TaxID=3051663 RepID=A0AAW7M1B9_9MICO|nr:MULTISPECIES: ATP-binding protein [unclassified Demequina]MDN4478182.1 histidine kinase [Demequina sp. SYSU T00039-1]MDN4482739.1 histidine kinase [Demequina sp. SYSU T0a273]MDN4488368.1 histidine kinase [Demequina sp. SYSU T00039]MDN4490085.1 histidine kinase [Demequina sp. SYSU T00068]
MTASSARLAHPLERRRTAPQWWRALVGGVLLAIAIALLAHRFHWAQLSWWLLPLLVFIIGVVLVWSPLENAVQLDARRPDVVALFSREVWLRMLAGLALAIGALWWFAQADPDWNPVVRALAIPLVIVVGLGLLLAPWWLRLIRQVRIERERRVREFERAEIAAHLHDSVLQTLTLIRAKADDPAAVARLARAQERDLRTYLYQERQSAAASVAVALAEAIAEVEDRQGVEIELVTVGDTQTTGALHAAVRAVAEAATNAARHAVPPYSVYAEVTERAFEAFVRDGGPGFDPEAIPEGRLGIRESIVGRVARFGGTATVASVPGGRTEVAIVIHPEAREDRS